MHIKYAKYAKTMLCEVLDIRAFSSNVKDLNLKKIKISPEPVAAMTASCPEVVKVVGAIYVRCLSEDWQICQMTAKLFVSFFSIPENSGKSPKGYRKRHNASREPHKLAPAQHFLAGEFRFLIRSMYKVWSSKSKDQPN